VKVAGVFTLGFGFATLMWLLSLALVDLLVFKRVADHVVLWMLAAPGLVIISLGGFLVRLARRREADATRLP